jgi:hypothetical protein
MQTWVLVSPVFNVCMEDHICKNSHLYSNCTINVLIVLLISAPYFLTYIELRDTQDVSAWIYQPTHHTQQIVVTGWVISRRKINTKRPYYRSMHFRAFKSGVPFSAVFSSKVHLTRSPASLKHDIMALLKY